jgi:serine/threonine-protein kinase HipA
MMPSNEYATMRWAGAVGISTPELQLVHRDDVPDIPDIAWAGEHLAYAIRRFDRVQGAKVHIEDLAQVRSLYPDDKYLGNFETVANLFYRGFDVGSLTEFIRRLAFSIACGNDDAHLKNWSLIYPDSRRPQISPAYDLVSSAAYPGYGLARDLGLKLAGTRSYSRVSRTSFALLAEKLGNVVDAEAVAVSTMEAMLDTWDVFASSLGAADQLAEGVREHFDRLVRQFGF